MKKTCKRFVCLLTVWLLVFGLTACGSSGKEPLRAPEEGAVPTVSIETIYGTLAFPKELQDSLRHMEVTQDQTAMEVFYMISGEGEKELFRILYADAMMGTHLGYLTTDSGEIPVSYTMAEYEDSHFASEEERKLYYSMMDAFSVVVNSIYADTRFSETKHLDPVGSGQIQLRYWKAELPENVRFTETEENGIYRVDFYGEVGGERIDLYTIALGDMEAETMLGLYTVKGEQKPVMIQTCDVEIYETWPEDAQITIHQMMNSLNVMIQAIMADADFAQSAEDPGVG